MYKVIFHPDVIRQLEKFGEIQNLVGFLSDITQGLRKNPYAYPTSPKQANWVIFTTARKSLPGRVIPSLKVYAAIDEENKKVTIIWIRINPNDPSMMM